MSDQVLRKLARQAALGVQPERYRAARDRAGETLKVGRWAGHPDELASHSEVIQGLLWALVRARGSRVIALPWFQEWLDLGRFEKGSLAGLTITDRRFHPPRRYRVGLAFADVEVSTVVGSPPVGPQMRAAGLGPHLNPKWVMGYSGDPASQAMMGIATHSAKRGDPVLMLRAGRFPVGVAGHPHWGWPATRSASRT
jgi:hypothetical protein